VGFKYIDLFAGIGGFHAAMEAFGGELVFASEIDPSASRVYALNWGNFPSGDITKLANDARMEVPDHDVLLAGFPCQPFSKSGFQRGMEESRGTLFWNIAKIIEVKRPKVVLLENVRNIAGPRHLHEWNVIIATLRSLGYRVDSRPLIVSPHRIHPSFGGRPQVRERVFIGATFVGEGETARADAEPIDLSSIYQNWDPENWDLRTHLPIEDAIEGLSQLDTQLSDSEELWLDAWNDFVVTFRSHFPDEKLPGFPIWVDEWRAFDDLHIEPSTPKWKANFLTKNSLFYSEHKTVLDAWLDRWNMLTGFPPSRRKFEWQAQTANSLDECVVHFRPSGLRVKRATYLPALVAITQTSILGKERRRITIREAARLQGLPDDFTFGAQKNSISYRQLGNGVNVAAVFHVFRQLIVRDSEYLGEHIEKFLGVVNSPTSPDDFDFSIDSEISKKHSISN
jgi:DNA (cytosine-5)-methyltransferase 1